MKLLPPKVNLMLPRVFDKLALSLLCLFTATISFAQNYSLSFDGNDAEADHAMVNSFTHSTSEMTIEAWVKVDALKAGYMTMLDFSGDNPYFGFNGNDLIIYMNPGAIVARQDFLPYVGTWTHVAVTIENGSQRLYINGTEVSYTQNLGGTLGPGATTFASAATSFGIGRFTGSDSSFDGLMDELRIWDDIRTPTELTANMNTELVGNESGLIAYYNFNEGSGTTLGDLAGTPEPGTFLNGGTNIPAADGTTAGPIWSTDAAPLLNPSLTFDGVNDYVDMGTGIRSDLTGTANITVEAWVYTTSSKTFQIIFSNYNGQLQSLLRLDDRRITFWVNNGSFQAASSTATVPLNTWTHVAGSWDGSTIRVYMDGVLDGSNAVSGTMNSNGGNYRIGGEIANEWFQGQIDEVRAWSTTRTDSEILTYKDEEIDPATPGLLGYYRLNEGSGTTVADLSPNGYNGTFGVGGSAPVWNTSGPALSGAVPVPCEDPIITEIVTDNTSCSVGNGALTVIPSTAGGEPAGNYTVVIYLTSDVTMTPIASGSNVDNATGITATGLVPDLYTAEVTNNDTGCATSQTYAVNDNTSLPSIDGGSVVITFESTGGATDGALDATGAGQGGSGSYTYNWYADAGLTTPIASTASISSLTAGTYYLEVVDDATDCISSAQLFDILVAPQNALNFDGTDDVVGLGNDASFSIGTSFSFETWVRVESLPVGKNAFIFNKWQSGLEDKVLAISPTGNVVFGLFNIFSLNSVTAIPLDTWVHVAVTYDGSNARIFIDGAEDASMAASGDIADGTGSMYLGGNGDGRPAGEFAYLDGTLEEARFWNVARTATEILGNLTTVIESAPGLVSYFDFNNSGNTSLVDKVGTNNGTLSNFDFAGTSSDWIASTIPSCAPNGKFIGSTDSDWSDPSNWCGGVVPTSSNVTEDVVVSIDSDIVENEDLVLNASDFQVSEGTSLTLDLNSNALQLTNGATFTNNGTVFFEAGTNVTDVAENFINNGTIKGFFTFDNNFTNPTQGTVAPGASPGCANFAADFTNSGTLEIEVDGLTPCTEHDQITVGATANLGGTLDVTLGYTPVNGDQIIIIDATTISGTFGVVNLPDADWSIAYDSPSPGQVSLNYSNPTQTIGFDGPGGVGDTDGTTDLTLWFKADAGVFSDAGITPVLDAGAVEQWNDFSGYGTNATQVTPAAKASWNDNLANGQPGLTFDGGDFTSFSDANLPAGSNPRTLIAVTSRTSDGERYFFSYGASVGGQRYSVGGSAAGSSYGIENNGSGAVNNAAVTTVNVPSIVSVVYSGGALSTLQLYDNGTNYAVTGGTTPLTALNQGRIGGLSGGGLNWQGDIYEVIQINGALNHASRTIIENYLSAKYDIVISNDLYAGDTAPNGNYDFDVAGIGNTASGSDPTATSASLTISNGAFLLDDGDYVFAGHDGTANAVVQSDLPVGYNNRWARDWYIDIEDAGANNGLITLTFDYAEAGLGIPASNFALITRPTGSGAYSVAATNAVVLGNKVSFDIDVASLVDGHRYTLADDNVPTYPGGVSTNLSLWMKADLGVIGTTEVSQWNDQSAGALDATQGTAANRPALTDNAFNFNPAISFDGADDFFTSTLDISPTGSPDLTTIIVFNSDQDTNTPLRKLFGHDNGNFHRSIGIDNRSGNNFNYFAGSNGVGGYFDLVANTNYISATTYTSSNTISGYIDGNQLFTGNPTPITGGLTNLTIGAIGPVPTENWDGQIAEVIMYSGTLLDAERERIETYLAIKYGISLDQTVATNYIASDGNPVWDGTANVAYNNNIAGIGRDDISALNQKQSITADGVLSVGLGSIEFSNAVNSNTFANDLAYLIWGDNDLDVAYAARDISNVPPGIDSRIQRIWVASEANSDVGNVTLRFDLSGEGFPGTATAANFTLLLDTDADFSTGAIELSANSFAGEIVEFTGVNVANGQFITLGIAGIASVQNALTFDGTDDHGSIGSNVFGGPYTGPFTIEAWVNSSLTGNNNAALGSGIFKNMESGSGAIGDLALTINHLGQIGILNWREAAVDADGYAVSDASIPADTWTHVAASWDGSVNRIFINGVEQTFTTASTSTGWGAGFEIGRVNPAVQWHYDGTMDELRVWNVARSAVDITNNLYNELDPVAETNLVAYYQFNEASGTNIPDAKSSFDATWNGSGGGTNTVPAWAASDVLMNPASIVTTTNPTGPGSLLEAINYANSNSGTTITFNIAESAPWVINLGTALPQITAANTVIDGESQPGWTFGDPNAMVQINGSGIGGNANGIDIDAAGVEVYGLILTGFDGNINNGAIYLASDAADNAIIGSDTRGNIIHGTAGGNAIYIIEADNATIQGNRIGTLDGSTLSAIGDHGISTTGEINTLTIGGDFFTGAGNVISGAPTNRYGLNLFGSGGGSGLSNVTISGNKIGTDDAANAAIPNALGGINILGTISAVTIGGPSASDLNIISGNGDDGIIIQAGNTFDIDGNFIGLQSDGSSALGNGGSGIRIATSATNVNIGSNNQNIISRNTIFGIEFSGNNSLNTSLGTNVISCNQNAAIGYGSGPITPGATIDNISFTTATISTGAADGSTAYIYIAEDGCNNDQPIAFAGSASVASGQATITGAFAPSIHYVALIEDVNGYSTFSPSVLANFVLVDNTSDTGTGSFRAALDSANTYPGTTIYFNLPGSGPWDIVLGSDLPDISGQGTIIDATTQPFWDISTANIPNIVGNPGINIGLNFTSNYAEVYGLRLSGFNIDGIRFNVLGSDANGYTFGANGKGNIFTGNNNGIQLLTYTGGGSIQGNYFGILPDGTTTGTANGTGILVGTNGDNIQIGGLGAGESNIITNNTNQGIRISGADFATIQGNLIGLDPTESTAFGGTNGIDLSSSTGSTVEQNVISGHTIGVRINASSGNTIIRNWIGVASDGTTEFPNTDGISIIDNLDSDNNIIGSQSNTGDANVIAHNSNVGILIDGAGNNGNQIQRNQFFANTNGAISLTGGAHNGILPPAIDAISVGTTVTGTGTDGHMIDLYYSDGSGQGNTFIGTTPVSGGVWSIGSLSLIGGDRVVATTTSLIDGTSEFTLETEFMSTPYPEFEGAGNALTFDGGNDFVDVGTRIAEGRTDITVEAWINPASVSPGGVTTNEIRTIISEGDVSAGNTAFMVGFTGNGGSTDLTTFINAGGGPLIASVPANTIPLNDWTHIAVTWSSGSSQINLYVNGENVANNVSAGSALITTTENFLIGGSTNGEEDYFDGQIDEVRVWDFAMPESSIREYMTRKVTNAHPSFANLLAYYRMDDSGDALNLQDFNNAQNATIDGAVYSPSGAPLGDESIYEYTYTTGSGRGFDGFRVNNLEVANLPLHVYRINQTPSNTVVTGFDNIDRPAYYGVFSPGQTYTVEDSVNGLSPARRILRRADGTDPVWTPISGPIGIDVDQFRMYAYGVQGSGQFTSSNDQSPYPTPADAGFAMSFDGASSQVVVSDNDNLSFGNGSIDQPFSVEAWVNFSAFGTNQSIVSKRQNGINREYRLSLTSANELEVLFFDEGSGGQLEAQSASLDAATLNINEWNHIAFTYDGSSTGTGIILYLNGEVVSTTPNNITYTAMSNTPADLELGIDAGLIPLNGQLDEVRIWNIALTEMNIRDNMIEKIDGNTDNIQNLVSYYRFDENSGATATDIARSNDGTVTSGTPTVSGAPQGQGSLYSYGATPGILNTAQFGEDINIHFEDATGGIHGYLVGGNPNQLQANGFNDLDQGKYYGVFAPNGQKVTLRMDYNNLSSYDPDRRIVFRDDATDNAAVGGWERLSGLINSDVTNDSIFAFNVAQGEFSTARLNPPSSYPQLGDTNPGSALNFDGTDDYVIVPSLESAFDASQGFTLEAWITPANLNGTVQHILGINNSYRLIVDTNDQLQLGTSDGATPSNVTNVAALLTNSNPVHVAATLTAAGDAELFIDGLSVHTESGVSIPQSPVSSFYIGGLDIGENFFGEIDEVRVWSTVVAAGDILAFANTTDIATHPNYESMIAYHKFDEGSGSILEDVFANNDGTWNGPSSPNLVPNWVPSGALADAPEQNALNFDGTDYIDFVRQTFPSGLTYEAWIRTTSTANTTVYDGNPALTVIGDNDGGIEGAFGVHDGKIRYTHWQGNLTDFDQIDGTVNVNDGEWHHIAVTHKSGSNEVSIYLDGVLDVTATSTIYATGISANRVGSSYLDGSGNDNFFDGDIDEVRIWNVALPPEEIRNFLYTDDLSASTNLINLVLHYNFNQGSAGNDNSGETSVPDQTSNALDGGLAAFDLIGANSNFVSSGNTSFTPSAPVLTASNITAFNISETTADLSWTNGDGDRRVVVVREGIGNPFPAPADGIFGEAGQYGLGTDLDNGWFVVYNGYGNSTTVENLSGGTDYEVAVLELNGPPTFDTYNTNAGVNNPTSFSTDAPISNFALDFDGMNDHTQVSSPLGFPVGGAPRTLEFWFKSNVDLTTDTDHGIVQYGTNVSGQMFGLITTSNAPGKLYFFGFANDVAGVTDIIQDQWYHAAVTYDGTDITLYLDGNFEASSSLSLNTIMDANGFTIGRRPIQEDFWDGQIDEVRIWDYARSQTEIQNDLNNQLFGNEAGLVAYYPMSDGTGSTIVTDLTGGGNNASLVNMDENTDWVAGPVLNPPVTPSFFSEDFEDETLPNIASSGPFILGTGLWDGEGVLESGDIDARGGIGNGARIEPAAGNYIQTPPLDGATTLSIWFKGESSGGSYDVLGSNDGITYDVDLGTINPDPVYQEFVFDFTTIYDPSYTGAVRIAYNSGANPLFIDDVSSDSDVLRGTVTLTTEPVSDATVNAGDTDVLIYKFSATFADADSYSEGFLLTPVGADSLDFELNGFDFYQNRTTDDLGTATLLGTGSWSPGDPIPRNSIGILFNEIYTPGETVYFYVTADITSTANPVTFNMAEPTVESFGFGNGDKLNGGLAVGPSITINAGGDVTAPTVVSLTPSANPIIDIDTQFEIVVEFDENMDTGIDPTINFPLEDPSATLTFNGGVWDDTQNFRVTYDVVDVNVNLTGVDVQVTGAQDVSGNIQNTYDGPDAFDIDTENPVITVDTYGTSITSPELTGTIDDNTALINIEVAGNNYAATNNADGTWNLPAGTITPGLTDGVYDVIATATDGVGNFGTDNTNDELTISQTVVTLAAENVTSTSFIARWSEGLDVQTYQIDVSTVADFSSFLTGFQGSQTTETSIEVDGLDFSSQYYYRVRVVNTSDEVSDNSNTTTVKTTIDPETVSDSTALAQIFAAVNPQGLNWETARLRDWTGVALDDATRTRVEVVSISGSSATGEMPNPFTGDAVGGLSEMTLMDISDNTISGLMDFSATAISNLNISSNNLLFDDLEPIAAAAIATVDYSNQASIQYNESLGGDQIEVRHLNDFSLSVTTAGSSNEYTWYRNDVEISSNDDFIVNNAIAIVLAIDYDNMGAFRTEVTSALVPGLIIDVDPQAVLAIVDVVMTLTDNNDVILTGETFDGALLETVRREQGYDTLESAANVGAEFVFNDVVLGDYLCGIEPDNSAFIATYFGDAFQWDEADTVFLRKDTTLTIKMTAVPRELTEEDGEGSLEVLIEEDFGDDGGRVDARRRASKRKCGLRRKRTGGRVDQDDEFELIAYGETDENGEFKFGFLPTGTYRFFVEYPGIPIDESSFVQFEVGEAGISDKDFKLQAFANEDGIEVTIEAVLGVILEYFKDLEIYPNPSTEYLNVRYRHLKSQDVTAQLVDLYGNTKWTQDLRNGYDGEIRIDVTDFEEGIYFLRFYDRTSANDNVVTFRVVVKD